MTHHTTTHLARVTLLTRLPTRKPGLERCDAMLQVPRSAALDQAPYISASTIDPFTADTLQAAHDQQRPVWVEVRLGAYGYDIITAELQESRS